MYGANLRFPKEELNLEPRPEWWMVRPEEIIATCQATKRGQANVIAQTPGGFPVYAVFYGDFSEPAPQSNWSAGSSSNTYKSYFQREGQKQTILFMAGIHGAEAESVCAATNLIQMLETGKDFRGKTNDELAALIDQYRFIIIPCANMDGRAISPDHLRHATFEDFRAVSQGCWKSDGSLIGWRGSKEWFPLPLDKVKNPGGYPNADGFNIMHDACPGHIRTAEARGILQLCERWCVDAVLNAHSCEGQPHFIQPTLLSYPAHQRRGAAWATTANDLMFKAGLRKEALAEPLKARGATFNLNTMMMYASGALAVTLECSTCSLENNYTFDQLIEPNYIALKVMMEDGLTAPIADRSTLFQG
ncbi:MAG: hypothetical protein IJT83_04855 [Victivallales bacterium]|nr:hypothetical protein [Victivallales bacterium]MBR4220879.1 hypothetical protein [Victivallales bacterium]